MSEIRYFQFVNWEKWYPRKDYKSMPWVKMSTNFFEDQKLDGLSSLQMLALIWLIIESGRQNLGEGKVRLHASFMKSSLRLQRSFSISSVLSSLLQRDVIIEITPENPYVKRAQELRVRGKNKNPLNPLKKKQGEGDGLQPLGSIAERLKQNMASKEN